MSTPRSIIVASSSGNGKWSTPKRKCVESETGLSFLARLETRPSLSELESTLFPDKLQPGDIIEITGGPGCGKSALSLHLIAMTLLPKTWKGINLGGCESGVVYVDSDVQFSILHLENMMQKKIRIILKKSKSALKGENEAYDMQSLTVDKEELQDFLQSSKQSIQDELNKLTKSCLKNFYYLRCTDSTQFAVTLLSMSELFQNKCNLSLAVIDSISAFYWYDLTYRAETWYKLEQYYNKVFKVFLSHVRKYKIILVATRQSLFQKKPSSSSSSSMAFPYSMSSKQPVQMDEDESEEGTKEYEYMGKEWANCVTCRICLSIIKCPVLGIWDEGVSESTQVCANTHTTDKKKGQIDGTGSSNSTCDRPVYSAEVVSKGKKIQLPFTVHEEGIRWKN